MCAEIRRDTRDISELSERDGPTIFELDHAAAARALRMTGGIRRDGGGK